MLPISQTRSPVFLALTFSHVFSRLQHYCRPAVQCLMFSALLCGIRQGTLAHTVHFSAVEVPLTPALVTPTTPAVDDSGNVYAAEYLFGDVKDIQAVNGIISPLSTIRTLSIGFN